MACVLNDIFMLLDSSLKYTYSCYHNKTLITSRVRNAYVGGQGRVKRYLVCGKLLSDMESEKRGSAGSSYSVHILLLNMNVLKDRGKGQQSSFSY